MRTTSRRNFLQSTIATGGLLATVGGSFARANNRPKGFAGFSGVQLAIATICVDGFKNQRHEPALVHIPELGFQNVEFNVWYPELITPTYLSSLKTRCSERGLTPVSLQGNGFGHVGRDGAIKDIAHKLTLMHGCQLLGCRMVKCTGAKRGAEGGIEAVIATCRELTPVAEELGIVITLENHANNVLERPEDYDAVFSAIDSPNLGMCLDIGHFEAVGVDIHKLIERFGTRILEVDLKDCKARGEGHQVVVFGQGVTDFDAVLSHLKETGYRGYLVVEQAWAQPQDGWQQDLRDAYTRFKKWERSA